MKNKIAAYFMALIIAVQPTLLWASDLDSAFNNLLGAGAAISVNEPGRYQSGARNSFIAGGLELRVPRASNVPQLFSATAPRITAGCGGISAHFGGFSFISGEEFEALLQSIASGAALGFVSMMVLKVLCPMCEAVVQFLKTLAAQAARLARNACEFGKSMARSYLNGDSATQGSPQEVCGTTLSYSGSEPDFLSGYLGKSCNTITSAVDSLLGEGGGGSSGSGSADEEIRCKVGAGNITWMRLRAFDSGGAEGTAAWNDAYERKILLMNLLGVELGKGGETMGEIQCAKLTVTDGPTEEAPVTFCPPMLETSTLLGYFMCGVPTSDTMAPPGNPSNSVKAYCSQYYSASTNLAEAQLYYCKDSKADCNQVELRSAEGLFKGEGFLTRINNLLLQGVSAVQNDQPMPEEVVRLMQVAPYPLYQAINAAAVYPAATADLIDAMSTLVAEQAAVAYLDDALRMQGRTGGQGICLTQNQARQILDTVSAMRSGMRANRQLIAQNITIQESITESIRQLNLAIQRQTLTQEMLGSGQYVQGLNKSVSNVNAGGNAEITP